MIIGRWNNYLKSVLEEKDKNQRAVMKKWYDDVTAKPLGNERFHKGGFWKEP